MKKLLAALLLLIAVAFGSLAYADANITIHNCENYTITYNVFWIDHPWRDKWPQPYPIMGGELKPGKSHTSEYSYEPGKYIVRWGDDSGTLVYISKGDKLILVCKGVC